MAGAADRRWITAREVAERLGLHIVTVYQMAGRGQLPHGRVGSALRFDWKSIEKGLEQGQAQGQKAGR